MAEIDLLNVVRYNPIVSCVPTWHLFFYLRLALARLFLYPIHATILRLQGMDLIQILQPKQKDSLFYLEKLGVYCFFCFLLVPSDLPISRCLVRSSRRYQSYLRSSHLVGHQEVYRRNRSLVVLGRPRFLFLHSENILCRWGWYNVTAYLASKYKHLIAFCLCALSREWVNDLLGFRIALVSMSSARSITHGTRA